jgi:ferredoxin
LPVKESSPTSKRRARPALSLHDLFAGERVRHAALAAGQVVPDATRYIQCGICSYDCPVGIDVRSFSWRGLPVTDSRCIRCGECAQRCPRRTLRMLTFAARLSVRLPEDYLPFNPDEE